jgi:hypothetical protein
MGSPAALNSAVPTTHIVPAPVSIRAGLVVGADRKLVTNGPPTIWIPVALSLTIWMPVAVGT